MAHSEDYIRNKMYELEKEKVELERKKVKTLLDIRDTILVADTLILGNMADKAEAEKSISIYKSCKEAMDGVLKQIDERWSE